MLLGDTLGHLDTSQGGDAISRLSHWSSALLTGHAED
jgi:hypothetical protein